MGAENDPSNRRVLIVDDDERVHQDFILMLAPSSPEAATDELARAFGLDIAEYFPKFELIHARSGKEAYDKVEEAQKAGRPIAVTYMDFTMPPGWDGIETTRRIREIDENIEVVIMTAQPDGLKFSEIMHEMRSLRKVQFRRKPIVYPMEIQQTTRALVEKWDVAKELAEKTRQIELNKQQLEALLNSTGDAIAMFDDVSGRVLFANRSYAKMFGLTVEELSDMSADELRQGIRQYFQNPHQLEQAETEFYEDPGNVVGKAVELLIPRKVIYQEISPVYDVDEEEPIGHLVVYSEAAKELQIAQLEDQIRRISAEVTKEYSFHKIIGNSKRMLDMYGMMQQAIQSDITVLVRGESGTGKELVAKSIHFNSQRKSKPFIAVNCAAIPETLIESELFGHERGAFTGASARRIGRFEQADGGTILLDEIGEMPIPLQARLLRVLQERELQRVGGTSTIPIDVRVVASTNKNLETAMKAGEFREDLFYRIAAFPITIPPLRERPEDIPLLARHFLNDAAKRNDKSIIDISSEALQALMNYDWPGNVRELENVIERAVLLETSAGMLNAASLPLEIHSSRKQHRILSSQGEETTITEVLPLEEVEKRALIRALEATGNNIRQTANVLGINRATVYRKLEKYSLTRRE